MEIVTKYSIGDKVWRVYNNTVVIGEVSGVFIAIGESNMEISYTFNNSDIKYNEMDIFKSKEELIKNL